MPSVHPGTILPSLTPRAPRSATRTDACWKSPIFPPARARPNCWCRPVQTPFKARSFHSARMKASGSSSISLPALPRFAPRSTPTRSPRTTKFNCCRRFATACASRSRSRTKIWRRLPTARSTRPDCAPPFRKIPNWSSTKPIRRPAATRGVWFGQPSPPRTPTPARSSWTLRIRSPRASRSKASSGRPQQSPTRPATCR